MPVPSTGAITLRGIFSEKNENDYAAQNEDGESNISLRGLSENSINDSTGGDITINTDGWLATTNTSGQTGSGIAGAPYSMLEFRGYDHDFVNVNTTASVKSGYIHNIIQGPRGGNRYTFSKGYNSDDNGTGQLGYSTPPTGAINNATIGVTANIGACNMVFAATSSFLGAGRYELEIAGTNSNSGFTTVTFTHTSLSNSVSLNRTAANYSYANGRRKWEWLIALNTFNGSPHTYGSVTSSGYTSRVFGDANTGSGTDANFRTNVVLS